MILKEKKGMKAIHKLIIEARMFSYQNNSKKNELLLDKVEYLLALILDDSDKSDFFDDYLRSTCEEFCFMQIYTNFIG